MQGVAISSLAELHGAERLRSSNRVGLACLRRVSLGALRFLVSVVLACSSVRAADEPKSSSLRIATFDIDATPPIGMMAYDPVTNKWDLGLRRAASCCWERASRLCSAPWIGSASPTKGTMRFATRWRARRAHAAARGGAHAAPARRAGLRFFRRANSQGCRHGSAPIRRQLSAAGDFQSGNRRARIAAARATGHPSWPGRGARREGRLEPPHSRSGRQGPRHALDGHHGSRGARRAGGHD